MRLSPFSSLVKTNATIGRLNFAFDAFSGIAIPPRPRRKYAPARRFASCCRGHERTLWFSSKRMYWNPFLSSSSQRFNWRRYRPICWVSGAAITALFLFDSPAARLQIAREKFHCFIERCSLFLRDLKSLPVSLASRKLSGDQAEFNFESVEDLDSNESLEEYIAAMSIKSPKKETGKKRRTGKPPPGFTNAFQAYALGDIIPLTHDVALLRFLF